MTAPPIAAPHVVGVDLSLTATGIAWPDGTTMTHGRTGLTAFTTAPGDRSHALSTLAGELLDRIQRATIAVMEKPQLVALEGVPTSGTKVDSERCYLWWRLVEKLHLFGIPVLAVPPTSLKLYATSMGNANKREVIQSCKDELPAWQIMKTGKSGKVLTTPDDNKVDAVWLMAIACHLLGHPIVEPTKFRERALEKLILPPGVRQ